MRKILLTGAAGVIGTDVARLLPHHGEFWRLTDIRPASPSATSRSGNVEWVQADLTDPEQAKRLCDGVDAVIHLAGQPREREWSELLGPNIVTCTNLWEAMRQQGVKRVIFGSSNHASGMYPATQTLSGTEAARPDSRYGITKVFGEALGSCYADKFNIKCFSIRIGTYREKPSIERELATWVSPRDLASLIRVGLQAEYHNEIVYGVSNNSRSWWRNDRAYQLGYAPQDNAETYAPEIAMTAPDKNDVTTVLQGANHAGRDFTGNLEWLANRRVGE
jgi:uronate dehydrogenase